MDKDYVIQEIKIAMMRVATVYGSSVLFDDKTEINKNRQSNLKLALHNLEHAVQNIEGPEDKCPEDNGIEDLGVALFDEDFGAFKPNVNYISFN